MRNYLTNATTITAELSEICAKLALLERNDEDNAEAINDLSEDMRKELDNIYEAIPALSVKLPQARKQPRPSAACWILRTITNRTMNALTAPTHPREIIKDNWAVLGMTQKRLAEIINIPVAMLNGILNGKRPLSAEVALRIEAATEMDAETLVNMQSRYNLMQARNDKKVNDFLNNIRKMCAAL